ncbi:hypothetical protein UAS_00841 [Enterococcus asini ATCC 700915]|uniref:Phosphoribulokinase/uridine kinase domain-containing protein n=1 Tax=Enterococcus asini ATCC 700915 TaxID=1158606 RepID=R2RXR8_9ENTE|nr:AAA family ATPase [Enterococcus asini]EOH88080.1 hypothetical protein UAS_00841 [Enterococcus asini ATCC 700915]EOT55877.1 hypothetical protein I579_02241 [Enterococcus asini ATCC 700915]OJG12856.1 hypothetical protein RU94_GL001862 [Enterococcus asini]
MEVSKEWLYQKIAEAVQSLPRPTIIGINGAITSGKTTLARRLAEYLQKQNTPVTVVHIDDFHQPRSLRQKEASPAYYLAHALDLPRITDLVQKIKAGGFEETWQVLDMGTDEYSKSVEFAITPDSIVIIEGVLLYQKALVELFDYKVYLDISPKEILERGKLRDVPLYGARILEQYRQFFIPVQQLYEETAQPKAYSDLVVDVTNFERMIVKDKKSCPR